MLTLDKKTELYNCVLRQFPDAGLYRVSRVCEWLSTNGYSFEKMGYNDFRSFAEDFSEMFAFQSDDNDEFIEIKKWREAGDCSKYTTDHPADNFFGSVDIILNDDIIEMTQRSLYALTKIIGGNITVSQIKQEIYDKFNQAKANNKLEFHGMRYTFPIGCSQDGFLLNGIITKNLNHNASKSLYFSFCKTDIPSKQRFLANNDKLHGMPIPAQQTEQVYQLLTENFEEEKKLHMAAVSKLLTDNGIDRMKYGYYKMKDFLLQMPFLELTEEVLGGVPQTMVTIHKEAKAAEKSQAVKYSVEIPEKSLTEFCYLPAKPVSIIENFLKDNGISSDFYSIIQDLSEDFDSARKNYNIRTYEDKIIFPSRYLKSDNSFVEITLKPSAYDGKKWFLYYVDTLVRDKIHTTNPGKQLENFAFLGSWSSFLSELAAKAIDEEWDFVNNTRRNYQILILYIKYTFSRLMREKKVCISADERFAAFNTGLADDHYDDIYACFIPNETGGTPWKFVGFCTAASGGLGKQLVNSFNPLPQPASYFQKNEDLLFDSSRQLHTDFEHIIIDNINRLPLQFLSDQFVDNAEAMEIITGLKECGSDRTKRIALCEKLRELLLHNNRLFVRIQNRLKDAIELAKKRVRWNYKTAIPLYFPKHDSMSLMLPLALVDESKPDVALVVELTKSGCYQGHTILTLSQAYIDARLLCRLTGDWLVPGKILALPEETSEDEI